MEIVNALAHLYPTAQPLVDYIVTNRNGIQAIAVWNLPQPQPTEAELAAAETAYNTAAAMRQAEATALCQQVVTLAQSAMGQPVNALTAAQVRALVALLLWKAEAMTNQGTVRPLGEWLDR